MRTHGTLTRWNDDRGFGFITPAGGKDDIFVHISAFPRDGMRPRLSELISFETENGPDGRLRAVRVMRPGQRAARHAPIVQARQRPANRLRGMVLVLVITGCLGAFAYSRYNRSKALPELPAPVTSNPAKYACDGRTMCREMTSCQEATWFIRNCPDTKMDGDDDGVPCESQWCD
jgi:cold shock CspA family protein